MHIGVIKPHLLKKILWKTFKNAANNEFSGIEFDVRKTKDGKLVVVHDASIDRVSNGHGFVRDLTYDELSKYNFGSKDVPSKIPLFEDVLTSFPGLFKIVELKTEVDLEPFLDRVDDKTYFMSFDNGLIKKIEEKNTPN